MAEQPAAVNNLHALLIGIDFYLPNGIPGVGTYPSLGGCVRDINNVEALLRSRLGLPPEPRPAT